MELFNNRVLLKILLIEYVILKSSLLLILVGVFSIFLIKRELALIKEASCLVNSVHTIFLLYIFMVGCNTSHKLL